MNKESMKSPEEILEGKIMKIQRRREWRRLLTEGIVFIAILCLVFQCVIGIAFVSSDSMQPELRDGEVVVFYRLDQGYQKGDLVLIRREGNLEYIKRIVAVEQDKVELTEEGELLVNEEPEDREFVFGSTLPAEGGIAYPYEVPKDSYFVLGDNREESRDSRAFGAVREEEITGRVFFHLGLTK